ncbi:hypothetical protein CCACVL1_01222 [Corchorus capsularis]|uniref:Uncharacterized protein n=1 Tax=Corchorus capsularis TaxID=210143 RepID=A0A1R3KL61_COCAP|nr:hypothetical protein CCACVL1_01222 [Corchorus capsularis]
MDKEFNGGRQAKPPLLVLVQRGGDVKFSTYSAQNIACKTASFLFYR